MTCSSCCLPASSAVSEGTCFGLQFPASALRDYSSCKLNLRIGVSHGIAPCCHFGLTHELLRRRFSDSSSDAVGRVSGSVVGDMLRKSDLARCALKGHERRFSSMSPSPLFGQRACAGCMTARRCANVLAGGVSSTTESRDPHDAQREGRHTTCSSLCLSV